MAMMKLIKAHEVNVLGPTVGFFATLHCAHGLCPCPSKSIQRKKPPPRQRTRLVSVMFPAPSIVINVADVCLFFLLVYVPSLAIHGKKIRLDRVTRSFLFLSCLLPFAFCPPLFLDGCRIARFVSMGLNKGIGRKQVMDLSCATVSQDSICSLKFSGQEDQCRILPELQHVRIGICQRSVLSRWRSEMYLLSFSDLCGWEHKETIVLDAPKDTFMHEKVDKGGRRKRETIDKRAKHFLIPLLPCIYPVQKWKCQKKKNTHTHITKHLHLRRD